MARENEIMPFSEYLRRLEESLAAGAEPANEGGQGAYEVEGNLEPMVAYSLTAEPNEAQGAVEQDAVQEEASTESDSLSFIDKEEVASSTLIAEANDTAETAPEPSELSDQHSELLVQDENDLDALFQELLKASVNPAASVEAQSSSESSGAQATEPAAAASNARIEQMEQQMQQMQQMLQQTLAALQQTAQLVNLQQETEAFRMVARSLQADGIFLTEQQLRQIWDDAYAKGIPPSVAVKAYAFDMLQRERPSLQMVAQQPPKFPFFMPAPPPAREERPNQFRSYREFLQELQYQQEQRQSSNSWNE